jgi:hypothetical protein
MLDEVVNENPPMSAIAITPPPPNNVETSAASVTLLHEVVALPVDDEIYDAVHVPDISQPWKKYQKFMIGGGCLLLIGLVVGVVVSLGLDPVYSEVSIPVCQYFTL